MEEKIVRKAFFITAVLLMWASISMCMVLSVQAPSIERWSWRGYVFFDLFNREPFYREYVVAYEESSTAILDVRVLNDYAPATPINVSAVKVGFDWNVNYTSDQVSMDSPVVMQHDEVRVFTVRFTLPNSTVASNLYLHSYNIYVEHVNSTTEPKKLLTPWIEHSYDEDYYFVVYSHDQAAARRASRMISTITKPGFNTSMAKLLWSRANNETNAAGFMYSQGDFGASKEHYDKALSLMNEAFEYEEDREGSLDSAEVALIEAQVRQLDAWANYANGLSNMWVLIGVAAVLFAIGYIIHGFSALRRPSLVAAA